MRDVHEVLRERENAVERVRREVEVLRLVAPLLVDETSAGWKPAVEPAFRSEAMTETVSQHREGFGIVVPLPADETDDFVAKIRARRIEAERDANEAKLGRAKRISRQLRRIAAPLLGADPFAR